MQVAPVAAIKDVARTNWRLFIASPLVLLSLLICEGFYGGNACAGVKALQKMRCASRIDCPLTV